MPKIIISNDGVNSSAILYQHNTTNFFSSTLTNCGRVQRSGKDKLAKGTFSKILSNSTFIHTGQEMVGE